GTLLRARGNIAAVVAVIARATDTEHARTLLRTMQHLARDCESSKLDAAGAMSGELQAQMRIDLRKSQELRYGENPHQKAALYVGDKPAEASVAFAKQLHGKELSYINLLDADAALSAVKELAEPAACIVKHATPCGYAIGDDIAFAFHSAFAGDPLAAFGGIV